MCRFGSRCWRPHCWFEHGRDRVERVVEMANYWPEEIKSILGPCASDVSPIKAVKATAPQVDCLVPSLYDSATPVLSQVYQEQIDVGQTTQEAKKKVWWELDLDLFRNDWLMGELDVEDGRRERKPSRKKIVNRTRLKHPDFQ